jgi:hypothetical protein
MYDHLVDVPKNLEAQLVEAREAKTELVRHRRCVYVGVMRLPPELLTGWHVSRARDGRAAQLATHAYPGRMDDHGFDW